MVALQLLCSVINQSINQTSIAPISPVKPGSVAGQPNQCSTAKSRKHFRNINRPWGIFPNNNACTAVAVQYIGCTVAAVQYIGCTVAAVQYIGCTVAAVQYNGSTVAAVQYNGSTAAAVQYIGCTVAAVQYNGYSAAAVQASLH